MEELDHLRHDNASYIEQTATFFQILSHLYHAEKEVVPANQIAEYIKNNCTKDLTLEMICEAFNFSKNHVINIFKKEYGMTTGQYIKRQY